MSITVTRICATFILILLISLLIISLEVNVVHAAVNSSAIMDSVLDKYKTAAESWGAVIKERATWLFFVLATISMVWTFSQLMFHRSSLAEFFGETIRFMLFTGFFLWLLRNGPQMADAIINSLKQIGNLASGQPGVSPSGIVDIGFEIFSNSCRTSFFSFLDDPLVSVGNLIVSGLILVILSLVGVNMLLQFCAAWILAYAGIFFLGFGGSRWTSDMALNYFKTVLGIGASLMTMVLIIGIGTSIVAEYQKQMSEVAELQELAILLVVAITLLLLVDKLPAMVAGIITGAGIGSMGVGSFGAGAAVGAAMAAGSGAMWLGSKAVDGAKGLAVMAGGVGSAVKAACASAGQAMQQGTGAFSGKDSGGSGLSLGKAMGTKAAFATEVGKALGKGIGAAAKGSFNEAVGKSAGGKVAAAINKKPGGDK